MPNTTLERVQAFWNTEACGTHYVTDFADDAEFFANYRRWRYEVACWYIPELVPFEGFAGRDVLEIGCGNGADGALFASHGARYTGVDLTETAVDATRRHFAVLGLPGTFQTENAEALSFPDASFDLVYSWGVLHHTEHPGRAFAEVHRVLRPGGLAIVMLYHRHSFNYYARIMTYMRARVLLTTLARLPRWRRDRAQLEEEAGLAVRGNERPAIWDVHYRNVLRDGFGYIRSARFVHHCTDGPACPVAYVYSAAEVRRLFGAFGDVQTRAAHFPLRQYLGAWVPRGVERAAAATLGWNLVVYARK